jgi:hypothetical protein
VTTLQSITHLNTETLWLTAGLFLLTERHHFELVETTMIDYTPTTEEVKDSYVSMQICLAYPNPDAEFDRWLAEEHRKAKEEAWYLGAMTAVNYALNGSPSLPENPYEEESK